MAGGSAKICKSCQGMDERKEHSEVRKKKEKAFLVSDNSGSVIFQYN